MPKKEISMQALQKFLQAKKNRIDVAKNLQKLFALMNCKKFSEFENKDKYERVKNFLEKHPELITSQVEADPREMGYNTPFNVAALCSSRAILEHIYKKLPSDYTFEFDKDALAWAIDGGNFETVRFLLEKIEFLAKLEEGWLDKMIQSAQGFVDAEAVDDTFGKEPSDYKKVLDALKNFQTAQSPIEKPKRRGGCRFFGSALESESISVPAPAAVTVETPTLAVSAPAPEATPAVEGVVAEDHAAAESQWNPKMRFKKEAASARKVLTA